MTNSLRTTTITFTGDVNNTITEVANNSNSPGATDLITLASGSNTVAVPTGGSAPTACTIVMPVGNVVPVLLKKVAGDTGILLHPTNSTSIALDPTVTSFVLSAGNTLVGLRLVWS